METQKLMIEFNNKKFPGRVHIGNEPKYLFVTHHGILSNNTSFRYLEKWLGESAIVVNYDARVNGQNKMRASRLASTYVRDLRDVIRWSKQQYPNIPVVTIGSSWGAAVVASYAYKYSTKEVYKNVAWSIPYNFISSRESKEVQNETKEKINKYKELGIKEPTKLTWAIKFLLMLSTNINVKAYVKIDLTKTANNKILAKINKIKKPVATPIKLFYATGKLILSANRKLKSINKNKEEEFLYIQSTIDSYITEKKIKQLKKWTGNGVKTYYLNEGKHAFQWENESGLNLKVFDMVIQWLNLNQK